MNPRCRGVSMLFLVLAPLVASCSDAGTAGDWAGTVETLANGATRITNPERGLWQDGSPWRLEPELVLGKVEGEDADVFASIIAFETDGDGRLYVLDMQANELRIFGADGSHIRTVGRKGSGPGEYTRANGLLWIADDTLLVVDQEGGRYSVLTRDGDFVRSVPRRLGFYGGAFSGGYDRGRVYEISSVGRGEDRHAALLGTPIRDPVGGASVLGATDTVMLPEGPPAEYFRAETAVGQMSFGVPFSPRTVYFLDGTGGIWHGHGGAFRVYRSSLDGDTLAEIVLRGTPEPVSQQERDAWLGSSPFLDQFRKLGGKLDPDRIPTSKPYFDNLFVDADGYLWLRVPAAPGETVLAVVDPDGRYLGRVRIEGNGHGSLFRFIVRNGQLYGIAGDDLGVPHMYVYRIEK